MQFLYVAFGSGAECVTHLTIAEQLRYVTVDQIGPVVQEIDEISKMIMALIKKIKTRQTRKPVRKSNGMEIATNS